MEQDLELPVTSNKKKLYLPPKLISFGYSHKIEVTLDDKTIFFEKQLEDMTPAELSLKNS